MEHRKNLDTETRDTTDPFNYFNKSNDVTRTKEIRVKEGTKLRFSLSS